MNWLKSNVISVGLAIFSMFFGAGNLIFAVAVGKEFQDKLPIAMVGFILTAVCLPILGTVCILAFNGDYKAFFGRIGKVPGAFLCLFCLFIIGPMVAMPRVVTLSYTVFVPYFPNVSLVAFTLVFLGLTFLLTVTESRIMDILGYVISPLLILSLAVIMIAGWMQTSTVGISMASNGEVMLKGITYGAATLDFFTSIFFGAVTLSILHKALGKGLSDKEITSMGLKASVLGLGILAVIYVGLAWLGAAYGGGLENMNNGEVFQAILFRVLGKNGAIVMCAAVFFACLSTIIALAAVTAEYIQINILRSEKHYVSSLVIALVISGAFSILGLTNILELSWPVIMVLLPVVIALAVTNLLYQNFGFKPVKSLVFASLVLSIWLQKDMLGDFATNINKILGQYSSTTVVEASES